MLGKNQRSSRPQMGHVRNSNTEHLTAVHTVRYTVARQYRELDREQALVSS